MKRLLLLLSIFCFLHLIKAKAINITLWETDNDSSLPLDRLNSQLETLKSGNDVLKLRFEMMELQMQTLLHSVSKMNRKLDLILKFQPQNPAVPNIEDLSDENANDILLQSEEREVAKPQTRIMVMTDESGKEETKICLNSNANNGLVCSDIIFPTSCAASSSSKACWDNKCNIQNDLLGAKPFWVPCNNTIDNGGWTVIQRRINGSVEFNRSWDDYKRGFGDLYGEFWLGLDKIHALTTALNPMELLVELVDFDNEAKYAKYDSFAIGDEGSQYLLQSLGTYSGDAGDSLRYHENMKFTTKDRDNDNYGGNCVDIREGGWWFDNCSESNLNGRYFGPGTNPVPGARNGITWYKYHSYDYSMKSVQMMIRPRKI